MQFFDILLENEDITVLGGPATIDVSVDVGQKGDRGSRFFVGYGDPNLEGVIPSGEDIKLGDVFVNASTASRYGWLYIYLRTPSGNAWVQTLKLQPSVYVRDVDVLLSSGGEGNISIPLSSIVSDVSVVDIDKYIINLSVVSSLNINLVITQKFILGSNLAINVKAIQYNPSLGTWTPATGILRVGANVSVV
jgi:hypothetical protein